MGTPHKWAKEIKAWADGAEIESKDLALDVDWCSTYFPDWHSPDYEFRIKPQPKDPQYLYVWNINGEYYLCDYSEPVCTGDKYIGKIKLEEE